MPSKKFYQKLIQGALRKDIKSIQEIKRGNDGEKFKVISSDGSEYFCKIKDSGARTTELPNQEYAILQRVESEFVVKPIFSDVKGNRHLIIQPFIRGDDLEEKIRKTGSLSTEKVQRLAICLIDVAKSLNKFDSLHLDIKPANIIVGDDGKFYLVDFGAARFLKRIKNERIFPARRFIAPEVLSYLFNPTNLALQQISILSDMYGIGAVLYSAATGKDLADFFKTTGDILQKTPEPVRAVKPTINESLAQLIEKLIAKQPADRPTPGDALRILKNENLPVKSLPIYLFESKPKGEHKDIIPELNRQNNNCGLYWISDQEPTPSKKIAVKNLFWETPYADKANIEIQLLRQHQFGVTAFVVAGAEICNPLDSDVLVNNIESIRTAVNWKSKLAIKKDIIIVINIDESLLLSANITDIKNGYAALNIDGIILRVSVASYTSTLDRRHLSAIKDFIKPWVDRKQVIYFDGDLSILPLLPCGVYGLISTTYPKLNILAHRRIKPKMSMKPDGIYIPKFLSIISRDNVTSLRGNASGKLVTNCNCDACAQNLTKRNKLASWNRIERRKHFVNIFPIEIQAVKKLKPSEFKKRIVSALSEESRFSYIDFKQANLKIWLNFL